MARMPISRRKPPKRFWEAYNGLYGTAKAEQLELPCGVGLDGLGSSSCAKISKDLPHIPTEVEEQIVAATWLTKKNIIFFHVPNGGYRDIREGAKFKRMGVKAGVPDLVIPIARKGFHGLFVELKRMKGGSLSDSQAYWLEELKRQGYDVFVAKGANALIDYVKNYLGVE